MFVVLCPFIVAFFFLNCAEKTLSFSFKVCDAFLLGNLPIASYPWPNFWHETIILPLILVHVKRNSEIIIKCSRYEHVKMYNIDACWDVNTNMRLDFISLWSVVTYWRLFKYIWTTSGSFLFPWQSCIYCYINSNLCCMPFPTRGREGAGISLSDIYICQSQVTSLLSKRTMERLLFFCSF